jgi:hypothetical protein
MIRPFRSRPERSLRAWHRWYAAGAVVLLIGLAGCVLPREPSRTPRTAIEQLLLSHAAERSLAEVNLPLPVGTQVFVEVTGLARLDSYVGREGTQLGQPSPQQGLMYGPPTDLAFVRDVVAGRLGRMDFRISNRAEDAAYLVRVIVHALGTEQGESFFGVRSAQVVLLPFALPELPLYSAQYQKAQMRFSMDIFEAGTGRLLRSMPVSIGEAYFNQYTLLFFISFRRTDLTQPP